MFNSLHIYEFKCLTKNGRIEPEKPSPQKDKKLQRSGGAAPLILLGGPLNFKGTGLPIKGPARSRIGTLGPINTGSLHRIFSPLAPQNLLF